jgi:cell division protein FtsL
MALPAGDSRLFAPRPPARHRRVLPPAPPRPKSHQHIRRTRLVVFGALAIVVAAMLLVAIGSALVVSQQVRLDSAEQALAAASTRNTDLQVQRAELASPRKVLEVAQRKLGMVTPKTVLYLVPVKIGPTVGSTNHQTRK